MLQEKLDEIRSQLFDQHSSHDHQYILELLVVQSIEEEPDIGDVPLASSSELQKAISFAEFTKDFGSNRLELSLLYYRLAVQIGEELCILSAQDALKESYALFLWKQEGIPAPKLFKGNVQCRLLIPVLASNLIVQGNGDLAQKMLDLCRYSHPRTLCLIYMGGGRLARHLLNFLLYFEVVRLDKHPQIVQATHYVAQQLKITLDDSFMYSRAKELQPSEYSLKILKHIGKDTKALSLYIEHALELGKIKEAFDTICSFKEKDLRTSHFKVWLERVIDQNVDEFLIYPYPAQFRRILIKYLEQNAFDQGSYQAYHLLFKFYNDLKLHQMAAKWMCEYAYIMQNSHMKVSKKYAEFHKAMLLAINSMEVGKLESLICTKQVRTLQQLRQDFTLNQAMMKLLPLIPQLHQSSRKLDALEVINLCTSVGLYDQAYSIAKVCQISMAQIKLD